MLGKIVIKTKIEVVTGLHIGGNDAYSPIGAVDSPVIKDLATGQPIIPGSSLKGKLRTLLALSRNNDKEPNSDDIEILHLFGSSNSDKDEKKIIRARLQFSDAFISEEDSKVKDKKYTEVKFENSIDRKNLVATPRQIERVVKGCTFDAVIVYNVESDSKVDDDMKLLAKGMKLLQLDYLGGGGTRGNGRISFKSIDIETIEYGSNGKAAEIKKEFEDVKKYELLSF